MAYKHKLEAELESLRRVISAPASDRYSDLRKIRWGRRGNNYDQIQTLKNSGTVGVNEKLSDGWIKYGAAEDITGTKRYTQIRQEFNEDPTQPH